MVVSAASKGTFYCVTPSGAAYQDSHSPSLFMLLPVVSVLFSMLEQNVRS